MCSLFFWCDIYSVLLKWSSQFVFHCYRSWRRKWNAVSRAVTEIFLRHSSIAHQECAVLTVWQFPLFGMTQNILMWLPLPFSSRSLSLTHTANFTLITYTTTTVPVVQLPLLLLNQLLLLIQLHFKTLRVKYDSILLLLDHTTNNCIANIIVNTCWLSCRQQGKLHWTAAWCFHLFIFSSLNNDVIKVSSVHCTEFCCPSPPTQRDIQPKKEPSQIHRPVWRKGESRQKSELCHR